MNASDINDKNGGVEGDSSQQMSIYRELYNQKYNEAKALGWTGWGSPDREQRGSELYHRVVSNKLLPSTGSCLELGCGEGQLSRKLSLAGFDVTGVDISDTAIYWAIEKSQEYAVQYIRSDLSCPSPNLYAKYDLVVDGNCLHCVPEHQRIQFLSNVRSMMRNTAVFYVSSRCSKNSLIVTHSAGVKYRYFPSISDLVNELESQEFIVKDLQYFDRNDLYHVDIVAMKL